jgi:hypothetical protein
MLGMIVQDVIFDFVVIAEDQLATHRSFFARKSTAAEEAKVTGTLHWVGTFGPGQAVCGFVTMNQTLVVVRVMAATRTIRS